jgi:WD repeat-containing protein 1 (actin-interacting protein 1)
MYVVVCLLVFATNLGILRCEGDVEARKAVNTWTIGSGVNHQQVGGVWSEEAGIVSLSLSGDLNVIDPRTGDKPTRVIKVSTLCNPYMCHASYLASCFYEGSADPIPP